MHFVGLCSELVLPTGDHLKSDREQFQLYDLVLRLPPFFVIKIKHPGQNRKAIPTLRFAPLLPDPIFTAKSEEPRQNRKVGILKKE